DDDTSTIVVDARRLDAGLRAQPAERCFRQRLPATERGHVQPHAPRYVVAYSNVHCVPCRSSLGEDGSSGRLLLMRVHRDEMIERKDGQRDPAGRRGGGADLDHGKTKNPDRQYDLQVDKIAGGELDLAVDPLAEIDEGAGGFGIAREKLGLFLDLAR